MSEPTQRPATCPPEVYAKLLEEQLLQALKQGTAYRGAYLDLERRYNDLHQLAAAQQATLEELSARTAESVHSAAE